MLSRKGRVRSLLLYRSACESSEEEVWLSLKDTTRSVQGVHSEEEEAIVQVIMDTIMC